jgi:alkanesulfonate monooxygenase SsuD/methylene tetrahydromethanopterin reductase-like flavin-dependent oxidoreductase (luciferase family)
MRVITTIPQNKLKLAAAAAQDIEARGFDGIVTQENKHDAFLPLAAAATVTEKVELATGIAISFNRSPMVAAQMAWDLRESSNGRFVLGLGTQIKAHNEKRFSVPWSAPAPRMREYLQALRAIWHTWATGERLRFEGEHYTFTLMTPNFTPEHTVPGLPKVTLAAVGPYMEDTIVPRIDKGLAKTGRSRANFEISGGGFVATGPDDESVAKMLDWVRYRIGFYGSTPAYYPVLEAHGMQELGLKLNRMTKEGKWDKIAAEIPDDLLHLCCAVGRHDKIAGVIGTRFGGISDTLFASISTDVPSDFPPDLIQDIQKIPSVFKGHREAA